MTGEFRVVGVGCSAGGLQALRALLPGLPSEPAYLVAQHLDPRYPSQLVRLLRDFAPLPIREARDRERINPGEILVMPPGVQVECQGRSLLFQACATPGLPKPGIDRLFLSLAANFGARAVGVLLSGTSTDGIEGACAIRRAGGMAVVQSPDHAEFPELPQGALDCGCLELRAEAEEIGSLLRHQ